MRDIQQVAEENSFPTVELMDGFASELFREISKH